MDQAILDPGELDSLIADLEERISEVRVSDPTRPMAFSRKQCSLLACTLIYCVDEGGSF